MKVGVLKEAVGPERRVALVPESVGKLASDGVTVLVEAGAGVEAGFPDAQYRDAGAELSADRATVLRDADLVAMVGAPSFEGGTSDVAGMREGAALIGFLNPLQRADLLEALAARSISAWFRASTPARP